MSYFLKSSELEHRTCLETSISSWINEPQDVFLISLEGEKIHSHQALLSLHSSLLMGLFNKAKDACPGLSVDASSNTIATLIDLLAYGKTVGDKTVNIEDVARVAALLGINIANIVIESLPKTRKDVWPVSIKRMLNSSKSIVKNRPADIIAKTDNVIKTKLESMTECDTEHRKRATVNNITVTRSILPIVKEDIIHVEKTTVPGIQSILGRVVCGVCSNRFKHTKGLKRHLRRNNCKGQEENDNKEFKCDKCDKGFSLKSRLNTHRVIHMEVMPYKCDECGKNFSQVWNLKMHSKSQHGKELSDIKKCEEYVNYESVSVGVVSCVCSNRFKYKKGLKRHLRRDNCKAQAENDNKAFMCNKCDKRFSLQSSLYNHRIIHMEVKPFKCDECAKTFSQAYNLKIHSKSQHGIELSSVKKCEDFVNYESKEEQTDYMNKDDNVSDSGFVNLDQSESKNNIILKEEPLEVPTSYEKMCDACCIKFKSKKGLGQHIKSNSCKGYVNTTPKIFKCDKCEKTFTFKTSMRRHKLVHTDDYQMKMEITETQNSDRKTCSACCKTFKRRNTLRLHLKEGKCKGKVDDSPKDFECEQCGKAFGLGANLNKHKIIHMDELPFKCDECGKNFAQAWNMKSHYKSQHGIDIAVEKKRKYIEDDKSFEDILSGKDNISAGERTDKSEKVAKEEENEDVSFEF